MTPETETTQQAIETVPVTPQPKVETEIAEAEIENLINQAQQTESESRPFMQPKATTEKRRGRPRKNPDDPKWTGGNASTNQNEQANPETPPADFKEPCKLLFTMLSGLLEKSTKCPDMALMPPEIDALGNSWGAVCNRYMPNILGAHAELVIALTISAPVAIRLHTVAQMEIEKRKAAQAKEVVAIVEPKDGVTH
jgi:hypothetical protein